MTHMYGGAMLRVDLSTGKVSQEPTSSYAADFVGGRGINTRILYDEMPPEVSPLAPDSRLILGMGPLCGTPISASRTEITVRSPETGLLGSSSLGGSFGPELKYAGYDNVVITGKADRPVYLWIYNDEVEIRDAGHLWGKDTFETQDIIHSEMGPDAQVACIGPAGEHLVHFAAIQHGMKHGAGRTGTGAVMGAKNLKAIAVRGTGGVTLADPEKYLALVDELNHVMRDDPIVQERERHGMSFMNDAPDMYAARGETPRPVFSCDLYTKYEAKIKRYGCAGCPSQCMDLFPAEAKGGGALSCTLYLSPFYTVRNKDLEVELEAGLLSLRWGIDIVSAMVIISWLMELHEKGVITAKDTDGVPLEWGSKEAILGMFQKMTFREGFGDVLADGILPAAEKIGRGAVDYAPHMKGLPLYVPFKPEELVSKKGQALALAMSSRGDTMRSGALGVQEGFVTEGTALLYPDEKLATGFIEATRQKAKRISGTEKAFLANEYEGKPEIIIYAEDVVTIVDCLSACKLCSSYNCGRFGEEYQARLFSAGSGRETSVEQLFTLAGKVRTLERAYCARQGMTRELDSLPKRYLDKKITYTDINFENLKDIHFEEKSATLDSGKFEQMKDKYYALRGWDVATGTPTQETLVQNGLEDVAQDLKKRGKLPGKVTVA